MVTMANMTSNFTSRLKKVVVNQYSRDEALLQLFVDDFGLSVEECSGEEMEGTYTYLGSQVVDPDGVEALRSAVATDSLASFVSVDFPAMSR